MYNNQYLNPYNPQASVDRLTNQIQELERVRSQMQQQATHPNTPNLTQNFNLASVTNETIKYANSIDEVKNVFVVGDTPYFRKDMSMVWVKNARGDIKTYELNEIVEKDEKDIKIETLLGELEELKKELRKNEQSDHTDVIEPVTIKKPTTSKPISKSNK